MSENEIVTPRLRRLTLIGEGLKEMSAPGPAASVRLLIPMAGTELVVPTWDGNEFLLPDGERPVIRTFTPLRHDREDGSLQLEIVRHPGGAVSTWAETAAVGTEAALSGPGRAHEINDSATRYVLMGDETAVPAISQLLTTIAPDVEVEVHAETVSDEARVELPAHPSATVTWRVRDAEGAPGHTLVSAITDVHVDETTHVWAAGEAASVQAIRKHLFDTRGIPRAQTTVRGYWKPTRHL